MNKEEQVLVDQITEIGKDIGVIGLATVAPAVVGGVTVWAVGNYAESSTSINQTTSNAIAFLRQNNSDLQTAYWDATAAPAAKNSSQAATFDLNQIRVNDQYITSLKHDLYNQVPYNPNLPAAAGGIAILLTLAALAVPLKRLRNFFYTPRPPKAPKQPKPVKERREIMLAEEDLPSAEPDPHFNAAEWEGILKDPKYRRP